jgi:hypothetical protein
VPLFISSNLSITYFTQEVFPVPVFPYMNMLLGFSPLRAGEIADITVLISFSLCGSVDGI